MVLMNQHQANNGVLVPAAAAAFSSVLASDKLVYN